MLTLRKYYATWSHNKSYSSIFSCRFLSGRVGKASVKNLAFKILFYNPWDTLSLTSKVFLTENFQNYLICEKYNFFQIVLGVSSEPDSLSLMLTWKRPSFQSNSVTEKQDKIGSPLKDILVLKTQTHIGTAKQSSSLLPSLLLFVNIQCYIWHRRQFSRENLFKSMAIK